MPGRLHLPLLLPRGAQRMSGLSVAGVARDWELHRCLQRPLRHVLVEACNQETLLISSPGNWLRTPQSVCIVHS